MAKDSNTSKCPEMVSVCNKYGSVVRSEMSISNDGFSISLDVRTICYLLSKEDIEGFCRSLVSQLKRSLCNYEVDLEFGKYQFELSF